MLIYEAFAIQVSLQVLDDMDTRERETRAFVKLHNFIPDAKCLIITNSEEASLECDGIYKSISSGFNKKSYTFIIKIPSSV